MNLDKIIELIAEQVAREMLDVAAEAAPDRGDEEDPAMVRMLRRIALAIKRRGNGCRTGSCRSP